VLAQAGQAQGPDGRDQGQGPVGQVAFVGLNTRDPSEAPALSYVREFDVPYPSLVDQDSKLLLNFYGIISPSAMRVVPKAG